MESLGFIDSPTTATTWTESASETVGKHVAPPPTHEETTEQILSKWTPTDVGRGLLSKNIRWSLIIGVTMIIAGVATLGLWLYQLPAANEAKASTELTSVASGLDSELGTLESAVSDLTAGVATDFSVLEATARDLFDSSANMSSLDSTSRSLAADAAGAALEGARLAREAVTFQTALAPVLVVPDLETNGAFIELDEAARLFGDWQAGFDQMREALPEGALSAVSTELATLSGELEATQSRYLDALRSTDQWGAISALDDLEKRLNTISELLSESVAGVGARVAERVSEARTALAGLLD